MLHQKPVVFLGNLLLAGGLTCVLASCGGASQPPDVPSNETETEDAATQLASVNAASSDVEDPTRSGPEERPAQSPCAGYQVDLGKVLLQPSCEVPMPPPGEMKEREWKDVLEVSARTASPKVPPGGHIEITVAFGNKGKAPLPLDFIVDPEPRFDFEVYDAKGKRVDLPRGKEPRLPDSVAKAPPPVKHLARATVLATGTATVTVRWDAVRYAWAPPAKAKGAIPGRGYPKVPAGPLPPGKYTLKVLTPLVGFAEGPEKEVSQPKIVVEVGK